MLDKYRAYRSSPAKPIKLYRIEEDINCENNVASENLDVVKAIEKIFSEAHVDSEWYINPGESKEQIKVKKSRAEASGTIQYPTKANTYHKNIPF